MRQINDGLHKTFEQRRAQFIQQQRQHDRCRKAEQQAVHVKRQRIADQLPEVRVAQKLLEMRESDPRAVDKAHHRVIVLKSDDVAEDRPVMEKSEVQRRQRKHQIQILAANKPFLCGFQYMRHLFTPRPYRSGFVPPLHPD